MSKLRAWAFLFVAVIVTTLAWQLTTLRTDISDFFFSTEATEPSQQIGLAQSDELARRYLVSVGHAAVDAATVREFVTALQNSLSVTDRVTRVWSEPFNYQEIQQLLRRYAPYQRQLYSLQPEQDFDQLLTPSAMAARAADIRETLLGPDPSLAKSLLETDPMLLTQVWFNRINAIYQQSDNGPDDSVFFLESRDDGLDTLAQQRLQNTLVEVFDSLNTQYGQQFTLEYTGVPVFAVAIREQVGNDITRISSLSIGIVLLLSWLVFRSVRALLCVSLLLVTTAGMAALMTQWVFGYLHGLTLALGTTLIGICIDYFIHGLVQAGALQGKARVQTIRRIWPALLTGGATTLIGYTALSLSGFPGLQQIALFTGSGIVAALLITRFFLPGLMDLLQIQLQPGINLSWLLRCIPANSMRYFIIAISVLCLLAGSQRLQWSDDMGGLAPSLQQLISTDNRIRNRLSSMEPGRFVVVSGDSMEATLQTSEAVQQQLAELQQQGVLETYYPLFPWIASVQLQQRNTQAWNNAVNTNTQTDWAKALADQGLSSAAFPPLSTAPAEPLSYAQLQDTPASTLLSTQLLQEADGATAVIWLGQHQPDAVRDSLQSIDGARYFSQKDRIRALAGQYRDTAQQMLAWGLLAILLVLSLRYRSPAMALRVLTPAGLSIMLLVGLWGLSGVPMNMLHLIGLLLSAAVCVDYGVFFLENIRADHERTFQAITVSAITTAAAFASLGVAENPALHALAWTVAPGVLIGFLLCPIMLGTSDNNQSRQNHI